MLSVHTTCTLAYCCLIALLTSNAKAGAIATFQRVPGEFVGVTDDGSVVTSSSFIDQDGQNKLLSVPGSHVQIVAFSSYGSTLAGNRILPGSDFYRGWYRRSNGELIDIGTLTGDEPLPRSTTLIRGMSVDGNVLAGTSRNSEDKLQGFYWTLADGMEPIEYVPNAVSASVNGISADGSTVVGTSLITCPECDTSGIIVDCFGECGPSVATRHEAFIWNAEEGAISLGVLPLPEPRVVGVSSSGEPIVTAPLASALQRSHALGISDDGSTVFGYGTHEGFVWRKGTGMQPLPGLEQESGMFFPLDASANGSVIVGGIGGSCGINCFSGPGAVIWDEQNGSRLLKSVLIDQYDLEEEVGGLFLEHATYISADGRTIAGRVDRTRGGGTWIVTLPVPEPGSVFSVAILLLAASLRGSNSALFF